MNRSTAPISGDSNKETYAMQVEAERSTYVEQRVQKHGWTAGCDLKVRPMEPNCLMTGVKVSTEEPPILWAKLVSWSLALFTNPADMGIQ